MKRVDISLSLLNVIAIAFVLFMQALLTLIYISLNNVAVGSALLAYATCLIKGD